MTVYALLLAAGQGRRFGDAPKQLALRAGRPLASFALAALEAVLPGRVITVVGAGHQQILPVLQPRWPLVCSAWQEGLSKSLQTGLEALPADAGGALVALADQPCLSAADYQALVVEFEQNGQPVCASAENYLGVPAIFPRADFDALGELSGDRGARELLLRWQQAGRLRTVDLLAALLDVDTPAQLRDLPDCPVAFHMTTNGF